MTTTERASKSDAAYTFLRTSIAEGRYLPGDRLILDQLARELSISAIPVREAIRRLEAEGWVVVRRNAGAQVAAIEPEAYGNEMETLALLEGFATAQAAAVLDAAALDHATALNDEMRGVLDDFDPLRFTALNHDFHVTLCAATPNAHLRTELLSQWDRMNQVRRSTFAVVPKRARKSVEEHATLLGLIRCGAAPGTIEIFARQHKLNTLATLRKRMPHGA